MMNTNPRTSRFTINLLISAMEVANGMKTKEQAVNDLYASFDDPEKAECQFICKTLGLSEAELFREGRHA